MLDVGPASGVWMGEMGALVRGAAEAEKGIVEKIYGLEPNAEFHGMLREAAKREGLEGIYEPVGAKAQDAGRILGLGKGSVDTVVTVHVLCSVGEGAEEVVRALYELLKPGGQWLVYEHVVARKRVVRSWQGELIRSFSLTCRGRLCFAGGGKRWASRH